MKLLSQILLSILVAIVLVGFGFYLGTRPAPVVQLADRIGLAGLLPADWAGTDAGTVPAAIGRNPGQSQAADSAASDTVAPNSDGAAAAAADAAAPSAFGSAPNFTDVMSGTQTVAIQVAGPGGDALQASGAIELTGGESVPLPLSGTLAEIAVNVGDTVAAGNLLLAYDSVDLEQGVEKALDTLQSAQAQLDALDASADRAPVQQRVDQARANLETAAAALGQSRLHAPAGGTVLAVNVAVGEQVTRGAAAITLSANGAPALTVNLPIAALSQIGVDQPVTVTLAELPGQSFAGAVAAIAPAGPAQPDRAPVTVRLEGDDLYAVRPGMDATILFTDGSPGDGWLVPATAVQDRNGNRMVLVVRDGQPMPVSVTAGEQQGDLLVVQSPELQEDDQVIADVTTLFRRGGQGGAFPGRGSFPDNGSGQTQPQQP